MSHAEPVKVEVGLGDRAYDILIGSGLLARSGEEVARRLPGTRAAIVTDENVAAAHLDTLKAGLEKGGIQSAVITLPAGEKTKSFAHLEEVVDGVLAAKLERRDVVIALGGGVIGLLVVQLAKLAGAATIILSTRQASRRALAEELGATATVDPSAGDPVAAIAGPNGLAPGGVDVVLECAGVRDTVEQSMRIAKAGGTVVIVGVVPQGMKVEIEPFDLLFRELKVLGSFLNPFTHGRAAQLIASGAIEIDRLISRQVSLEEAPDVIANPPAPGEVKVLVVPGRG
ncbi:MAG: iron-containing alcohol dehydrogenase [Mesorhizobium sp.]|nr:MAG: iron-containing alcohol dehydrogenase [Mesorhizobium sp.]